MPQLPASIEQFIEWQKTLPVDEVWKEGRGEYRSAYGSYWYRAVACILLSGRVSPKAGGDPNMTGAHRLGKEANFNPYVLERIARLLLKARVLTAHRHGHYDEGPNFASWWVVRRVVQALGGLRLADFYTQEVRERGQRVGFEIVGLGGQRCLLAHVGWQSQLRVGRYGVEPARLEPIIQAELGQSPGEVDVHVIDEIGKMECLCPSFVEAVRGVVDGPAPVLATIALKGGGLISEVKARPDVRLVTVDPANRDDLPDQCASVLRGKGEVEP